MRIAGVALALVFAVFPGILPPTTANAGVAACAPETMSLLQKSDRPVTIACSLTLSPDELIRTPLVLSGSDASDTTVDCQGGRIRSEAPDQVAVTIQSTRRGEDQWDAPHHVVIRNCAIDGAIRIIGMGINGEAEAVRLSSLSKGHTERAEAAAPSDISLSNLRITAKGAIPLYAGPGTTKLAVTSSTFSGESGSVAIYLDAESGDNTIAGNDFRLVTKSRELIAVDGSAHDVISGNTFENPVNGGIFLYRNCGEGGTIRHQPPEHNVIRSNRFLYRAHDILSWWTTKPAVWIGSRQGGRSYCFHDPAHPFGSSLNARDEAHDNVVSDNTTEGGSASLFVDDDEDNRLQGNR